MYFISNNFDFRISEDTVSELESIVGMENVYEIKTAYDRVHTALIQRAIVHKFSSYNEQIMQLQIQIKKKNPRIDIHCSNVMTYVRRLANKIWYASQSIPWFWTNA